MVRCFVHEHASMNTSDHLVILNLPTVAIFNHQQSKQVNWPKAINSSHLFDYQAQVSAILHPHMEILH